MTDKKERSFTPVGDKLPKMGKASAITSISGLVVLQDELGKTHRGFVQRYETDINAHHLQAKKGDLVFFDVYNVAIPGVTGWAVLD